MYFSYACSMSNHFIPALNPETHLCSITLVLLPSRENELFIQKTCLFMETL